MPRKSFVQLQAELLTDFPNNISGQITPTILRAYLNKFLEAIRPAYATITQPGPNVQNVGNTYVPVVFASGFVSDVPDYTTTVASGKITRLEAGSTRVTLSLNVEAPSNRDVHFAIYKNGVITPWNISAMGEGAGNPATVALSALEYTGAAAEYQLMVRCDVVGPTAITISNSIMLVETVPVNTY